MHGHFRMEVADMETYDEKSVLPMLNGTLPTINQDEVIASVSHSGQIMIEHSPENVIDPQETSFLPIFTSDFDTKTMDYRDHLGSSCPC